MDPKEYTVNELRPFFIVGAVFGLCIVISLGIFLSITDCIIDDRAYDPEPLTLQGEINATNDNLMFEQNRGVHIWSDYRVFARWGENLTELETRTEDHTTAGDAIFFTSGEFHPEKGMEYNIRIIDMETNKVLWEDDIEAL